MRSGLKKAEGLGASGEGSHHWWLQRVSAILLIPLSLWMVFCLLQAMSDDLVTAREWIGQFYVAPMLGLFIVLALYHGQLGMQVIIEDYISHKGWQMASILFVKALLLLAGAVAIFSILRIAL